MLLSLFLWLGVGLSDLLLVSFCLTCSPLIPIQSFEASYQQAVKDVTEEMEQLINSKSVYVAKQQECTKKIRDLGLLPTDTFELYYIDTVQSMLYVFPLYCSNVLLFLCPKL